MSIVMISGLNHTFLKRQSLQNDLQLSCENGIHYGLSNFDLLDSKYQEFEYNKESYFLRQLNWGLFDLIFSKQEKYGVVQERIGLIGQLKTDTTIALYLANKNSALKLCGKTKISGKCYLPKKGVERGHLTGHFYEGSQLIYGSKSKSEKTLPSLNSIISDRIAAILNRELTEIDLESITGETPQIFSFSEETRIVRGRIISVDQAQLSGNLILEATDSIYIGKNSKLENIILIAPRIFLEEGFEGKVQLISERKIFVGRNSKLKYPSLLVLQEKKSDDQNHSIEIEEESIIAGGILAFSKQPDFRKQVRIKIREKAKVYGDIISYGQVELKGNLNGSLYASELSLENGAGKYVNYLLDAVIETKNIPENFSTVNWFEKDSNNKVLLAWLE